MDHPLDPGRRLRAVVAVHHEDLLTTLVSGGLTPSLEAAILARGDIRVLPALARCRLSEGSELRMASHPDPEVRTSLAQNASLGPRAQEVLLADRLTRAQVLRGSPLPSSLQQAVMASLHDVRAAHRSHELLSIAVNPSLEACHQRSLLEVRSESLREALASNPALTHQIQVALAASTSTRVRAALALNTGLLPEVQARLLEEYSELALVLAASPAVSTDVQYLLARDASTSVRQRLAGNPALTMGALEFLKSSSDHDVLAELTANPSVALDATFPVQALRQSGRGARFLTSALRHADQDAREALLVGFSGTLAELESVLLEFSATPA
jgi:hypothetical protein